MYKEFGGEERESSPFLIFCSCIAENMCTTSQGTRNLFASLVLGCVKCIVLYSVWDRGVLLIVGADLVACDNQVVTNPIQSL